MFADNRFLTALASKLVDIAENCADLDTKAELDELVDLTIEQIKVQSSALRVVFEKDDGDPDELTNEEINAFTSFEKNQ